MRTGATLLLCASVVPSFPELTVDASVWKGAARKLGTSALTVLMALVTPLLEKNPAKAFAAGGSTFVFSMSRLIVLAFATAMLHQLWNSGVDGWPDATL